MGYRKEARTYNLVFDDPELNGLEVKVRSLPLGKLRRFMGFKNSDADAVVQTEELLAAFAKALVSWNLEDESGVPIPASAQGIDDQEPAFIMSLVHAWIEAVSGVDDDLGKGSSSGRPSPEVSIPMETLSPSLAS